MKTLNLSRFALGALYSWLILFSLTSCSKKDQSPMENIIGKWQLSETAVTDVYNSDEQNNSWIKVSNEDSYILEFTSDNQIISYEKDPPCKGTYSNSQENTTVNFKCYPEQYDPIIPPQVKFDGKSVILIYRAGDEGSLKQKFSKITP